MAMLIRNTLSTLIILSFPTLAAKVPVTIR